TIASQACTIKQGQPILAEFILDFDVLGMALNRAGSLLKASMIADFCWKLLDCGFAVIEGGCQGVINVIDSALHPVKTIQKLADSIIEAGSLLTRIIAYEVATNLIIACAHDAQTYVDCRIEHALYVNAFLQPLAATIQEHSLRDGCKKAATIGIETWLTGKSIHV